MPVDEVLEEQDDTVQTPFDEAQDSETEDLRTTGHVKPPRKATSDRTRKFPLPPKKELLPDKAFAWIRALPPWAQERMEISVYRDYPVLDHLLTLTPEQRSDAKIHPRKYPKRIDKIGTVFESDNWQLEILKRWGSGDYRFYLIDCEGGQKKSGQFSVREILRTKCSLRDGEYPPVFDIRQLDLSDPRNESIKRDLMLKGALTRDEKLTGEKNEDSDMANQVAAEAVQTLSTAVVEMSKDKRSSASDGSNAVLMRMLEAADKRQAEAEARHAAEMRELRAALEAKTNAATLNPLDATRSMIDMAKTMVPPAPPPAPAQKDPMVELLMQMRKEDHERHMEEMKQREAQHVRELEAVNRRLDEMAKSANGGSQTAPGGNRSEFGVLDRFLEMKAKFDKLSGGGKDDTPSWLPAALEGGEMILNAAQNIVYNVAAMKAGSQPAAPDGTQTGPTQTASQQTAQPQPQQITQPTEEQKQVDQLRMFAAMIHPALIEALRTNVPGYVFAARLMAQYQPAAYDSVLAMGYNGILGDRGLLRLDPVKFGQLREAVMPNMQRLDAFVNEFLDSPKAHAAYNEILAQRGNPQPVPVRPNGPVPAAASEPPARKVMGPDGKLVEVKPPTQ